MKIYEQLFNIDYSDLDGSGKFSTLAFLKFFEQVATMHAEVLGCGLKDLLKINTGWVILNWKVKIYRRPLYGEKITVKSWVRKMDKIYSYRDFEVYDENKEIIAIATSNWIWRNFLEKTIQPISKEIRDNHEFYDRSVFEQTRFKKMQEPENYTHSFEYKILRRDIDTNHHVNNLNYLIFANEVLPEEVYRNADFKEVEIQYKKELKLRRTNKMFIYFTRRNAYSNNKKKRDR